MKDNRNRYNEEIEKYQSMDQFQVGIAVFDPDTTETQFNEKIMEADWRMYEQKNAYHQQQQAAQQELLQ